MRPQKGGLCPATIGNYTCLQERLPVKPCLAFPATDLMLTEDLYSSLRRLLPKPLAIDHGSHVVAPPSTTSLQSPPNSRIIGAANNADLVTGCAGPSDTAQMVEAPARQPSTAKSSRRLRIQEDQKGSAEVSAHPNPKILIDRIRKPEKHRARSSKIAVACENCR